MSATAAAQEEANRTELAVSGMNCSSCAQHVTDAIQSVPGVASAAVNLEAGRASVRWSDSSRVPAVLQAVSAAGYKAEVMERTDECHHHEQGEERQTGWTLNLWVGVLGTIPLML